MNRDGPAVELVGGVAVGGVDEEAEGFDMVGFFGGVEGDEWIFRLHCYHSCSFFSGRRKSETE